MNPVPENDVAMRGFGLESIIVQRADLVYRQEFRKAEIENGLHAAVAEILRHLGFGMVIDLRIPGYLLLLPLGRSLQGISALGAPMRMHVDDFHA